MNQSGAIAKRIIAAAVLMLSLSACSHSTSKVETPALGPDFTAADYQRTVALVNGKAITAAELKRAEKILLSNKPGLSIGPNLEKDFQLQALNQLISAELLYQESQKLEIKDLDQQSEKKLAETRSRFATNDDYVKGLKEIGLDEKSFAESVRRDLAIAYLVNTKVAADVKVSDEEVKKFYEQNPDKFTVPEQVRASHILVGVDSKATQEQRKAARDKAEKLRSELVNGADFALLAKDNSTCPSSKNGGDLGFFGKGRMDPAFEKAAFALETGALSNVVETRFGFHVIKLLDRKKAETVPFASVQKKIEEYLQGTKKNSAVELFVGQARQHAKIETML